VRDLFMFARPDGDFARA